MALSGSVVVGKVLRCHKSQVHGIAPFVLRWTTTTRGRVLILLALPGTWYRILVDGCA